MAWRFLILVRVNKYSIFEIIWAFEEINESAFRMSMREDTVASESVILLTKRF